jgi:hypothetical protein
VLQRVGGTGQALLLLLLLRLLVLVGATKGPCWLQPGVQGEGIIVSLAAPRLWQSAFLVVVPHVPVGGAVHCINIRQRQAPAAAAAADMR